MSIATSGTYFLSVGSYGDEGTGAYRLSVDELSFGETDMPNDKPTTYTFTEHDQSLDEPNSVWTHNSALDGLGERDWLKAQFDAGSSYGILLEGYGETPVVDTVIRIYDEAGNLVGKNDDAGYGAGKNSKGVHFFPIYTLLQRTPDFTIWRQPHIMTNITVAICFHTP